MAQLNKVVLITTSGTGTYTVPSDFVSLVSVEAIGGGGNGAQIFSTSLQYGGGGGGAYAKSTSMDTSSWVAGTTVLSYRVGVGGGTTGINGTSRSWMANSNTGTTEPTLSSNGVLADGGVSAVNKTGGSGGSTYNSIGDITYAGGSGGTGNATGSTHATGGGGGAAGPGGPGGAGYSGTSAGSGGGSGATYSLPGANSTSAAGGATAGQTGGGGGTTASSGTNGGGGGGRTSSGAGGSGGNGKGWIATSDGTQAGAGGGGGNSYTTTTGGNGGLFGGGGGPVTQPRVGGAGAQGIIVFTYASSTYVVAPPTPSNSTYTPITNYTDESGADLGSVLVTKSYLIDVYPNLIPSSQLPALWTWGSGTGGALGDGTSITKSSPVQILGAGNNWKQISIGTINNNMALKSDGTLWTWGCNICGVLGDGTTIGKSSPVQTIMQGTSWKQVSAGACAQGAIDSSGSLWIWGAGTCGFLGNGTTTNRCSPVQTIATGTNWAQLSIGSQGAIAIKTDGTLWGWGNNSTGGLGDGTTIDKCSPVQIIGTATTWKQVSIANGISAGIKTDGTLWTWGSNLCGQLGTGILLSCPVGDRSSPIQSFTLSGNWCTVSSAIAAGGSGSRAAIKTDGTLWTWGCAGNGGLGDGTTIDKCSPVQVIGAATTWKQVSINAGSNAVGAIKTDGTLWTWGRGNACGALGTGVGAVLRSSPGQTIAGGTTWCQVSMGFYISNGAIKTDGTLWTWGRNTSGQLGDGTSFSRSSPVQVIGAATTWCQASFGFDHAAAIKTDGTLWLWGSNYWGQLGTGTCTGVLCTVGTATSSPVQTLSSQTNWQSVGGNSAIQSGALFVWGCGAGGLGDGTTLDRCSPVQVVGGGNTWCSVCSKDFCAFIALKTNGTLWTWGCNTNGALGDGTTNPRSSPVQVIGAATTWCQASISGLNGAGVKTNGTLWIMGQNSCGVLGDGTTLQKCSPVQVIGAATTWKCVSVGSCNMAAIKTDGTLWTWGSAYCGALGDGTTIDKSSPVQVAGGGTTWCAVALSRSGNGFAIKTDGTLWSWGNGGAGNIGDGTTIGKCSPVQVTGGGTNWCCVTITVNSAFAIKTDGTLWSWGCFSNGILGSGVGLVARCSPGQVIGAATTWCAVKVNAAAGAGGGVASAVKKDGTLWTWGYDSAGGLALGLVGNMCDFRSSPVQVLGGGTTWCCVTLNRWVTSAIKKDGTLWTWGRNAYGVIPGDLGDGTTIDRSSPVQVAGGGTTWKWVSCGPYINQFAATKTDGTLWTWGRNIYGSLGDNTTSNRSSPVQIFSGSTGWCAAVPSLGVKSDGTLWVWGDSANGQLALTSVATDLCCSCVSSPVQTIAGGTTWKQVVTGNQFVSAIKTDGTLWVWGSNIGAALGTNNAISYSSPVQVFGGGNTWKQVGANNASAQIAIKTDGTLWTWGANGSGQLGDGTAITRSSPVQVGSGTNWKTACISSSDAAAIAELGDF